MKLATYNVYLPGQRIIIPHRADVKEIRKHRRIYLKNMYESNPPLLRTVDHDARTTPVTQPKGFCVLILTAAVAEEDVCEVGDVVSPLLPEYDLLAVDDPSLVNKQLVTIF